MKSEPISIEDFRIEDFRIEEAKHDAEQFPAECRESFSNVARSTMRHWRNDYPSGHWHQMVIYPVLCRSWLRDSTGEDNCDFSNAQIVKAARWKLEDSDSAGDSLTEFLSNWLWQGNKLA